MARKGLQTQVGCERVPARDRAALWSTSAAWPKDSDSSGPGERAAEYGTSHGHGANSHEKVASLEGLRGGAGLEPARGKIEEILRAAKKFDEGPALGCGTVTIFGPAPKKIRKLVPEW